MNEIELQKINYSFPVLAKKLIENFNSLLDEIPEEYYPIVFDIHDKKTIIYLCELSLFLDEVLTIDFDKNEKLSEEIVRNISNDYCAIFSIIYPLLKKLHSVILNEIGIEINTNNFPEYEYTYEVLLNNYASIPLVNYIKRLHKLK